MLEDDDGGGGSGGGGGGNGGGGALRVACIEELEDVCANLDAEVWWRPRATPRRASIAVPEGTDADIDAWITVRAVAGDRATMRREIAGVDPLLANTGDPLARSPLVIVGPPGPGRRS